MEKMKRSKSGDSKKIKEFKLSIRNLSYFINSLWRFFMNGKSSFNTINFIACHFIDLIIFETDEIDFEDFGYDPANEEEEEECLPIYYFINFLKNFAVSIFDAYKNVQNILSYLSLTLNETTYKERSARCSIIANLFIDLKKFEALIYTWRYSVDSLYKDLIKRMVVINKIRNNDFTYEHIKNEKRVTSLLSEFKKITTKKEFNLLCKIVQLLTDKNTKYKHYCKMRNEYVHAGRSIFDYSDIELFYESINFNEIIENFTSLYAIFCSFCLNYLLIILWFKTKII